VLEKFPFSELLNWYKIHGRHDLPWRDYSFDKKTLSYRVWLAETMLQQTQVERVKSYFHNILDAFPTIESLAKIDYEDFFPYYKGLGYYSRARNMLEAATQVVDEHN
jgi:A/G-specific adenine glycosylase